MLLLCGLPLFIKHVFNMFVCLNLCVCVCFLLLFNSVFKEQLVETFLGGPRLVAAGLELRAWIPFPSVVAHASRPGETRRRVQTQVRRPPRTSCMRWQLDVVFTTTNLPRFGSKSIHGPECFSTFLFLKPAPFPQDNHNQIIQHGVA